MSVLPNGVCSSCDLSDACDELGIAAVRTGALSPLWSGCPPLFGPLRTVRLEAAAGADSPLDALLDLVAESNGQIVFVDLDGRVDVQCWGTVLATAAHASGVLGALVNGAARDVDGLRALAFPTYARAVYPAAMRGRLRLAAVDEPVDLGGQTIAAGAVAAVDSSGAVFVPAERAAEATRLAVVRAREEQQQRERVAAGTDPRMIFGRRAEQ